MIALRRTGWLRMTVATMLAAVGLVFGLAGCSSERVYPSRPVVLGCRKSKIRMLISRPGKVRKLHAFSDGERTPESVTFRP